MARQNAEKSYFAKKNKEIYESLKSMSEGLYDKTKLLDAKEIFG